MKSSVSRWQVSARELLLITAVVALVIYGTLASRETRPKAPGTYICVIEVFDGEARIAMVATPMTFVLSP